MSRPRSLSAGFLLSIAVHVGIALAFVVLWNLLPLPPMRPIRVFALPDAPTRDEVGVDSTGKLLPLNTDTSGR